MFKKIVRAVWSHKNATESEAIIKAERNEHGKINSKNKLEKEKEKPKDKQKEQKKSKDKLKENVKIYDYRNA